MKGPKEPRLPPGYRLDKSDPDIWALRRPEGWVVAYFSAWGVTMQATRRIRTLVTPLTLSVDTDSTDACWI